MGGSQRLLLVVLCILGLAGCPPSGSLGLDDDDGADDDDATGVWPAEDFVSATTPAGLVVDLCDGVDQGGDGVLDPCCASPLGPSESVPAFSAQDALDWALNVITTRNAWVSGLAFELNALTAPDCAQGQLAELTCSSGVSTCPPLPAAHWRADPLMYSLTATTGTPDCLVGGSGTLVGVSGSPGDWPEGWDSGAGEAVQGEIVSASSDLWFAGAVGTSDATGVWQIGDPYTYGAMEVEEVRACLQFGAPVVTLRPGLYAFDILRWEIDAFSFSESDEGVVVRNPGTAPWTVAWSFPTGVCGGGSIEVASYSSPTAAPQHTASVVFPAQQGCAGCGDVTLDGVASGTWCFPQ